MTHPTSDTDLVKRYLKPVLDEVYGMDEWLEESPPPVERRQAYRWKARLEKGETISLRASTRRELIRLLGMEPTEVLPYGENRSVSGQS